jgi:hypothetical protein
MLYYQMDWVNLKHFKNQLHLVRSAVKGMSSKDISFGFNFEINKGAQINLRLPPKHEISRFLSVMRPLADPDGKLNYKDIASLLFKHHLITPSDKKLFDEKAHSLESGPIGIEIPNKGEHLKGIDFYLIFSKGEFFDEKESEANKIKEFQRYPMLQQYMVYASCSYCYDVYKLCEYLYSTIREVEQITSIPDSSGLDSPQCIYCLTKTGNFRYKEHVYPESLGNTELVLPPGCVCDDCNNGILSYLDQELVQHDIISFLRVLALSYNPKTGKFPVARFQNLRIEKKGPREIFIKQHNPRMGLTMEEQSDHVEGTLSLQGRKRFDPKLLGRSLYKIALGVICAYNGVPMALHRKYNIARDFILGKRLFPNNLLISMNGTPCGDIEGIHYLWNPGTPFSIKIFGVTFLFNLEPEPVLKMSEELHRMKFQCYSLSDCELQL